MSAYDEPEPYARMLTGQTRIEKRDACTILIAALAATGLHSGRRRFAVRCVSCDLVLHEGTTGPESRIAGHLADVADLRDRPLEVPPVVDQALSPERAALLARCLKDAGEMQRRVTRGDEDDQLEALQGAFETYFAMCRQKLGHDQVPIVTWETYAAIKHRRNDLRRRRHIAHPMRLEPHAGPGDCVICGCATGERHHLATHDANADATGG